MKIASAQRIPEAGHSCMAGRKENINYKDLCSREFITFAFVPEMLLSNNRAVNRKNSTLLSFCAANFSVVEDNV